MVDYLEDIMNFFWIILVLLISYLLGSANFSIIISKIYKKDIRKMGSGNAGFSNALRSFGVLFAILTFIGDFAKGFLSVYLGKILLNKCDISNELMFLVLVGFFCCMGHMYPCFFKFKGGKGILTTWAFNLLINWKIFLTLIITFLIILLIFKIISLASISAAVIYPISTLIFTNSISSFAISLALSIIIIIKHKSNIKRLIDGKENKISIKTDD